MNTEKKKYKQKRIFDVIFNPQKGKWILVLACLIIILEIISFFVIEDYLTEISIEQRLVERVFILVLCALWLFFHAPKYFYFDGKTIEFYDYKDNKRSNCDGNTKISFIIRRGRGFKRADYVLSELKNVEFSQNYIERQFNIGRITFSGMGTCNVKNQSENITHESKFTLYGIANFSEFKKEFLQKNQSKPPVQPVVCTAPIRG